MQTKRQIQKAETRKRILDAAYTVYAQKGFNTPTTQIAREANVSHGTIFVHFPTVENLVVVLIEEFGEKMNAELHQLAEKEENLYDFLEAHIRLLIRYEDFYTRLIEEKSVIPVEGRYLFINLQTVIAHHLSQVIEGHQQPLKEIPLHLLFNTWIGLLHYYLVNRELFTTGLVLSDYQDELIRHFIKMIEK
jgi:AcrR family transcriptional regulator